ncbi:GNAT family N-acetyltransferase [Halobellus sp. GM3]|uniref:GNAT family N-acetyltransferase n=1 Tax=Halobellus sp. GM3 TaxID=3458410 RepID=UPI00403DD123
MEFVCLGWPPDGPTLRLDYRRFAYAGKFVMSNTGKAVARGATAPDVVAGDATPPTFDDGPDGDVAESEFDTDVVAALAFNEDRTDDATLWYRYVTVRSDAKGHSLGPRLATFVAERAAGRGYERLRIAVNNPFAYEAMYRAGFAWTGRETGLAELVLERPAAGPEPNGAAADDSGLAADDSESDANNSETAAESHKDAETYRAGLDRFRERDPGDPEASFLADRLDSDPPEPLANPDG